MLDVDEVDDDDDDVDADDINVVPPLNLSSGRICAKGRDGFFTFTQSTRKIMMLIMIIMTVLTIK